MEASRRKFLIGTKPVAGGAAVGGYHETLGKAITLQRRGEKAKDAIYGNAPATEIMQKEGMIAYAKDFVVKPSVCNGCTTYCSVRVKIDTKSGEVVRVFGNPYSLLSSDPWCHTPIKHL